MCWKKSDLGYCSWKDYVEPFTWDFMSHDTGIMRTKMRSEDFTSVKIKSFQIKKLTEFSWDKLHVLQLLLANQRSNPSKMNSWRFLICPAVLNMATYRISQSPNLYKHCAKTARTIKLDRLGSRARSPRNWRAWASLWISQEHQRRIASKIMRKCQIVMLSDSFVIWKF